MYVLPLLRDNHWERAICRPHWHPASHGPPASSQVPGCPHALTGNHTTDLVWQLPKPLCAHLKWPRFQLMPHHCCPWRGPAVSLGFPPAMFTSPSLTSLPWAHSYLQPLISSSHCYYPIALTERRPSLDQRGFPPQLYWDITDIWRPCVIVLRCTVCGLDALTCCKMITAIDD